eukprot:symbB.v1.2.033724.t1/scaffold4228.1/size42811/1
MFDAPQRRCSQQGTMEVEEPWRAWHGPGSDSDTASTARIQPKLYATPDGEALPEEAQELLRSLGQAWETPSKAELRHCRAMLGRQAEQLHQYGQIRRLRSSPSYSQAQSALCMEDAQCEISCLRASIKRREAEVHVAQVELAYLNTLPWLVPASKIFFSLFVTDGGDELGLDKEFGLRGPPTSESREAVGHPLLDKQRGPAVRAQANRQGGNRVCRGRGRTNDSTLGCSP